ncbi:MULTISPECIES: class II aldolase/adducin family protein [unclassified Ruegeria]|uniref:class II aldolase/adducin family protein n=1 Tax=unclassified Ruegeria TaxID=2625375 RepID=UPI00149242BF|nr:MULTISPECIES: class II aldolase/adducin family protein [unclassified Ruegeria]NOD90630.1 class II aldolase [Ruegeria sp. HKCCD4318]NOE15867.1 class II aldolase [Ruegeria sp. HKCCD4318-2]NOG07859.1 class II aldolase [Ruegeria sp. HKCCD4315]
MSNVIRQDLAALYRLAHHYGWTDLTSTHISARLPEDPDHYLLNSHDLMFDEITASTLTRMSFDGQAVDDGPDSSKIVNLAGHIIHSGILLARPDVNYVIHSHTRAGVAVSAMPNGLLALSQHAGFVLGTLSSHPYQDSTAVEDEGALLARDLGNNFAMLLQNHGLLVVGRTAAEAFIYHYYLEMACKIQVDILSATDKPITITDDAMDALHDWGAPQNGPHGGVQWPALMRMLDRSVPEFRS